LFSLTHYSQCNMIVAVWGVVMADWCWCDLYLIKFGWCEVWSNHEGVIWNNWCGCDLYFHRILRRCDSKKNLGVISNDEFHTILRRCDLNKCCGCDFKWWWEVCVLDGARQVNIKSPWHNNDTPTPTMPPSPP
jgi:hypothetical protein